MVVGVVAFACGEGQPLLVGANEPIHVRGAQFIAGVLPGTPPIDAGPIGGDAGIAPPQGLAVTAINAASGIVVPGQAAKKFSGRVTDTAIAVGIRIADAGSGYWVLPVQEPDPQFQHELSWEAAIDFDLTLAPGYRQLRVVALDAAGNASAQLDFRVCVASRIPDNLNACEPSLAPPDAVISLQWDADSDLDLQVTTPDGVVVEPKSPTTVFVDGGRPGPDVGVIDRDSLFMCTPDGLRQEDLVWQQRPKGTFSIAVNMFDACKKPGTTFDILVYEAQGDGNDRHLVETLRRGGHLMSIDANGGANPGLFIVDYPFGD
jgi:hypothetical protein